MLFCLKGRFLMKLQLVSLLLFSDKRKDLLISLSEGPKTIDEALELLQIPRISLLPQIKKLRDEGLIVQKGDMCSLSAIGEILTKKMLPLVNASALLEENEYYWSQRNLNSIPFHLLKRIGELKSCQLIETGNNQEYECFPMSLSCFKESRELMFLCSYSQPYMPYFSQKCTKKGVNLKLIFGRNLFEKFVRYCKSEVEKIISQENITVFLRTGEASETPAFFALSEHSFFLGLFNKNGVFEGQYLFSSESKALKWGRELFEYYVESSEKVSSTNFS